MQDSLYIASLHRDSVPTVDTRGIVVATLDAEDVNPLGELSPKQERFAMALAHLDNAAAAYRIAYNVQPKTLPRSVAQCGYRLSHMPKIQARVKTIKAEASHGVVADLRELAQMYYDIATADPNELVRWVHTCCRHCYGINHGYQWKDDQEFTDRYMRISDAIEEGSKSKVPKEQAAAKKLVLPVYDGGVGYDKRLDPVLTCPECCGKGEQTHEIADTTKLTGKARLLYQGLEIGKDKVKVLMASQDGAREALGRMMGAFKDADPRKFNGTVVEGEAEERLPEGITAEDAARAYLGLMG